MSFQPIVFKYNPPPTVAEAAVNPSDIIVTGTNQVPVTNASSLASKFTNLKATSQYLQSVVLAMTANTGVSINLDANPAFSQAFKAVYGTDSPAPTIVPVGLYNNWLDADVGVSQLESALGTDSPIDVNPVMAASLVTLTNAVENALLENATFQSQLPLILRTLKTDAVVFQSWTDTINQYPVQSNPGSTDVSSTITTLFSDTSDRYSAAYSSLNSVITQPSPVEADIISVTAFSNSQSTPDLVRLSSLLSASQGLVLAPAFNDNNKDIANFSIARVAGDLGNMVCLSDRLATNVTKPLIQNPGPLGSLLQQGQASSQSNGVNPSGPLAGFTKSPNSSGLGTLSDQLAFTIGRIGLGTVSRNREFQRVIDKRLSVHNNSIQLLGTVKSNDTLLSVFSASISKTPVSLPNSSITVLPTASPVVSSILGI